MDMAEVKAFNAELSGLYDNKPPISKAKMSAITKGAIKAIKFYKHVVHSVEKFIQKCKPEYKVPGLYVIDSIVRQSRHQFGQDKDVFAPRFAKNMQQTFANLFRCPPEDKRNIIRVLNLWQKNNVFSSEVIQPLLDMADPNHPLHQEIQQQQNNTANGSSLSVSHNTTDKLSPGLAQQHTPHASTPMGDSFQDQPSGIPVGSKFNRKLLNDFDYDSEDDGPAPDSGPTISASQHSSSHTISHSNTQHNTTQNPTDALGSILTNPEIMRQLQSLQAQMQMMTGMQIPNLMPMMTDMQQNQNQNLPFLSQQEQQKHNENKDDQQNESDIEFVETGPQVIEIPDANDSRSPSPKSRRHRSRSKSPRRRRRSRSRSRSPRRRRDRERDRDRDREKDREKSNKEREIDREKQKEREKRGLPPIKKDHLSVCSTTLWVGHLSKLATPEELSDLFGGIGGVVSIDVVAPRGCAFVVMERRRDAHKAHSKLNKHKLHSKEITVAWAPGKGVKGREWKDYWEADLGVSYLPWEALHARWVLGALSLDALEDGGHVDEDTLPPWLPPRIIPKMDNIPMLGGIPTPNMMGNMPPGGMGGMGPDSLGNIGLPGMMAAGPPPRSMPMQVPRMPPPGMPAGLPPGLSGMAGVRTSLPEAALPHQGPLLGFPPAMPPHSIAQPGMVGGFLGGLLGVGGLVAGLPLQLPPHAQLPPAPAPAPAPAVPVSAPVSTVHTPPAARPTEISASDDAMELDTEEEAGASVPPLQLSDQMQALLSKPPPNFNASEPPPGFNLSEPPPFNSSQPPPNADEKQEDERKDRDRRDRDRRDRDRDRDRDNRRERGDRDRRERDRGRDRGDRERDERRSRERTERERGGGGGRERRDRERDRDRDRDRFSSRDKERSRERSPQRNSEGGEKSLQERLWEMANGKAAARDENQEDAQENREDGARMERPPLLEQPRPPPPAMMGNDGEKAVEPDSGWTQLPPPRMPPPHMNAPFRAELRMRGPPRPPMRGPWMEGPPGPGPGPFGPRFNGMGPPFNRPPFERPQFEAPMFDGPPRFERPPFNRMPFDNMPRPPFEGPRPPFDGPRPPFDGPRPPFDGPRPPFDGSRPPFDGPRQFDGPPFEGDRGFDGPPDFFDRNNRRFDDREQFNDRQWSGDRERDRDWDNRRNDWDDRRRDRRSRDHEDRFRDRNDRRRNFDDRRGPRDDRGRDDRDRSHGRDDKDRNAPRDDRDKTAFKDDKDKPRDDRRDRDEKSSRDERTSTREEKTTTREEKTTTREERNSRRDKDRKSRWGAAEETNTQIQETEKPEEQISMEVANQEIPPQVEKDRPNYENSEISNDNTADSRIENDEQSSKQEMFQRDNIVDYSESNEKSFNQPERNYETERNNANFDDSQNANDTNYEEKTETEVRTQEDVIPSCNQDNVATNFNQDSNDFSNQDKADVDVPQETSFKEPVVFDAPSDNFPSLYDTNEAIDTSFAAPAPIENENPAPTENEPSLNTPETSKSEDIFGQEQKEVEAPASEQAVTENKEGVA